MKCGYLLLLTIALALPVFGQDATVVELSKDDAAQAKQLYDAKQVADKAWDEFFSKTDKSHPEFMTMGGFEFSKDFRFVVAKHYPITGNGTLSWSGCPITISPSSTFSVPRAVNGTGTSPSITAIN